MFATVLQALVEPARLLGVPSLPRRVLDVAVPDRVAGRQAWVRDGRAAIEVRCGDRADAGVGHRAVERALEARQGVAWARVNAPLARVVVALEPSVDGGGPSLPELVALVEAAEGTSTSEPPRAASPHDGRAEAGTPARDGPDGRPPGEARPGQRGLVQDVPPGRGGLSRTGLALVADGVGVALAVGGGALGFARLPAEIASLVTLVDNQPRLRGLLEGTLGRPATDTTLAIANAVAQGLSNGLISLGLDAGYRLSATGEVRANTAAWRAREATYLSRPETAAAAPTVTERPRPLPPGPVERWADQAVLAAAGITAAAWGATGSPRRSVDLALATLPKPARFGREGFATQLGRVLSRRGAVITDPGVLRRLDRVDTVVLDVDVLVTGRLVLGAVATPPDADPGGVAAHLHALFDPDDVTGVHRSDPDDEDRAWSLGPVDALGLRSHWAERERTRFERGGVVQVLGLAHGRRLAALAAVVPETSASLEALAAAVRRAGHRLVVAGDPTGLPPGLADDVRPGGNRLVGTVRGLQVERDAVLLVSRRREALGCADCGIGVDDDGVPPWGAHVLVGDDLGVAALLLEASGVAEAASRRSVRFAQAASVLGGVATLTAPTARWASRALLAVNVSAALSFAQGAWTAVELTRRPLTPPVSRTPWHAMPVPAVLSRLGVDAGGLSVSEAARRRRRGEQPPAPSLARAVVEELANPLTPVLAAGAALSAAVGSTVDAALVVAVSGLSALVGGIQRRGTDRSLADLLSATSTTARVRRNGAEATVPAEDLVPGDVISVLPGDVVPADARVLEAVALEVDESSVTGEPFPVAKQVAPVVAATVAERSSMLYEGTTVAAGRGTAVVVATGTATEAGRSMAATRGAPPQTGVETRLARITSVTVPIALASAGAVVAAGFARGRALSQTIGAGVTLAVGAVPEGLPILVSAAQLAAARRLATRGALVRNPRTIEALGRVDVLCFDKTGTLTEGRIELAAVADSTTLTAVEDLQSGGSADATARAALQAGLRATPEPRPGHQLSHVTDRAVTEGAARAGVTRAAGPATWRRLAALPFEPSRGYHATLGTTPDRQHGEHGPGEALLSVKGAPEVVLPRCTSLQRRQDPRDPAGHRAPIRDADRRRLDARVEQLAGQGYRVLAVAERSARQPAGSADHELDESDVEGLTLLGFLALTDPVRPAAGTSITALRAAGVQIVMITGDHPRTAETVARRLDVLDGGRVVTGPELDALDDPALDTLLPNVRVVARGTPAHKVRVVQAFQRLHRVVAMTGDGANDAPAIRLADVGIALGQRGTPAARAAADLVVADDRLETILTALVEGRAMWGSVREALGILVGGNVGEIAFTVLAAALTGLSPLTARQLLLINMLTDLAPSLAVALRPPRSADAATLLAEGPETSLGAALTRDVSGRALATSAAAVAAWLTAQALGLGPAAGTVALTSLVTTQLGQTLLAGRGSRSVLAAGVGSGAVLAAVVQVPALGAFFGSVPLGPTGWALTLAAAAAGTALSPLLSAAAGDLLPVLLAARTSPAPPAPAPGARDDAPVAA